jgi:hypothetical protein
VVLQPHAAGDVDYNLSQILICLGASPLIAQSVGEIDSTPWCAGVSAVPRPSQGVPCAVVDAADVPLPSAI